MLVDQFIKLLECIPLPSQTAEVTFMAPVNEFFPRFGCPFQIFTDRGGISRVSFSVLSASCSRFTTQYRPSVKGQVERYNGTLMWTRCSAMSTKHRTVGMST